MLDGKRIRDDSPVNVKVILSGLWASTLFVFAYVDIVGFWRTDVIKGALDGKVPGAGANINQTFITEPGATTNRPRFANEAASFGEDPLAAHAHTRRRRQDPDS